MYAWIWRRLPGGVPGKVIGSAILILAVVALLFLVVFPYVDPRLPFSANQRRLVFEPCPHAGIGDGVDDRGGREARRVVLHVQALAHQVGGEILEAVQVLEATLEHRHFLAAVHPFDAERRLGVQFADGAGDGGPARLASRRRPTAAPCS